MLLETERLQIHKLTLEDAPFILELLNQPTWLRFLGDRGVRTLDDARAYLEHGPIAMYTRYGFGLYKVTRADATPIGMCGLIQREGLDDVDIGFALLSQFMGQGYAYEAAVAVLEYGHTTLGLQRIVGIVNPQNAASVALLERLGMRFERRVSLPGNPVELLLYATQQAPPA